MDEETAVHTNKRYTIQCLSDSHDSHFFSQISSKSKKTFPWFIIQSVVEDISFSHSCLTSVSSKAKQREYRDVSFISHQIKMAKNTVFFVLPSNQKSRKMSPLALMASICRSVATLALLLGSSDPGMAIPPRCCGDSACNDKFLSLGK